MGREAVGRVLLALFWLFLGAEDAVGGRRIEG
jgi:hypothetical protein